jgi:hypothetical protein
MAQLKSDFKLFDGVSEVALSDVVFLQSQKNRLTLIRKTIHGYRGYYELRDMYLDDASKRVVFESTFDEKLAESLVTLGVTWLKMARYSAENSGLSVLVNTSAKGENQQIYEGITRFLFNDTSFSFRLTALINDVDILIMKRSYRGASKNQLDLLPGKPTAIEIEEMIRKKESAVIKQVADLQRELNSYIEGVHVIEP